MDARDFLAHIFQSCKGVPVTCTKADGYVSRRWQPGIEPPGGVSYFCISTVRDQPRVRVLSRKTEDIVLTYVIVLDDVGTKVSRETIKLKPSYILESSPDNFHFGFVLAEGVEPARAAALLEALAAAGYTDPGAIRADRIMRLPGSLNDKFSPPFVCRIVEWNPGVEYALSELCVGFGVVPTDTPVSRVFTDLAPGQTDRELDWMQDRGMVLGGMNPRGWYPVRCPQEHLHTGDVDHGTDYKPGSPGAFVCLHGHCKEFKTAQLRAWILTQDPAAEVGVLDRQQVTEVGQRLGAALGVELQDAETTGPNSAPNANLLQRLISGLGEGSIFDRPRRNDEIEDMATLVVQDLIHVASEDAYWSSEAKGLISHRTVDDRWTTRMARAGLLTGETPTGRATQIAPHVWLRHNPSIVRATKLVHRLGDPLIVDGALNIAEPIPVWADVEGDPGLWLELVRFICVEDQEVTEAFLDWCAFVISAWDEKPGWHILLRGIQGTGKNLVMRPALHAVGVHGKDVNAIEMGGTFNTFLSKRLITVDELKMTTRGTVTGHDVYANLKTWTARGADTLSVNEKFKNPYTVANRSCWVITSNDSTPLPLEASDRRFLVIETPSRPKPKAWYSKCARWLHEEQGNEIVATWLRRRWASLPEARREALRQTPMMTKAKLDMIESASEGIAGAVQLAIAGKHGVAWPDLMRIEDVVGKLRLGANGLLPDSLLKQVSQQRVIPALREAGAVKLFDGRQIESGGRAVRLWCLRGEKAPLYEQLGQGKKMLDKYDELNAGEIAKFRVG